MRVLIIPDKFKGSLTATEVIQAVRRGLERYDPSIQSESVVASDGGDGFLESIRQTSNSIDSIEIDTTDPLGRPIRAEYLLDRCKGVAYVELARASGMELLPPEKRNPSLTTTFGTGTLIKSAIENGAKSVYIGIGGSATNDGGTGIATAMGYEFFDKLGLPVDPVGGQLFRIESIRAPQNPIQSDVKIFAINDVKNPLTGETGAAKVYGPQKGADPATVEFLDVGLDHLQQVVQRELAADAANLPGSGAAGGTGYGLKVFLGAEFLSGIEFVLTLAGADQKLSSGAFDWIITGEGRIDDQTAYGKLVRGVAEVGEKHGVPVIAVCGLLQLESNSIQDLGLQHVTQIHDDSRDLIETIRQADQLVVHAVEKVMKTLAG